MTTNHPLRAWRISKALTIDQVAALIAVSPAAVRSYETGRRYPRAQIMKRIERVTLCAVTASDFLQPYEVMDGASRPQSPLEMTRGDA